MRSFHGHLAALATANPEKEALLACDIEGAVTETISRAALLKKIRTAALYMRNRGVHTGDRVALAFGNCADLLILSWAAWSMGVVTVPLDTKRDTDELREYKIKASDAKLLVTQETLPKVRSTPGDVSW